MTTTLIVILAISVIWLNIVWYLIKEILKKKGCQAYYFVGHLKNISDFRRVIKKEKNEQLLVKYLRIMNLWKFSMLLFLIVLFCLIIRYNCIGFVIEANRFFLSK